LARTCWEISPAVTIRSAAARRLVAAFRERVFLQLTKQGMALAQDAGLMVAHLLTKVPESRAHWAVLNNPGAFSHNRPVLKGTEQGLYLDPVGAVYEARALVNDKKSFDILKNTFIFWKERFRSNAV